MTYSGIFIVLLIFSVAKWLAGWILFVGFVLILIVVSSLSEVMRRLKRGRAFSNKPDLTVPIDDDAIRHLETGMDYDVRSEVDS